MLHPSYSDLMNVVNKELEEGETPVVNSRYSIVMATSKRARQIVSGAQAQVNPKGKKALSIAIEELVNEKIHILAECAEEEEEKETEEVEKTEEAETTEETPDEGEEA